MDQAELLIYLLDVLERRKLPYAIAGSHASMAFGESRLTNDIDVVVGLTLSTLSNFCAAFPPPEYYVSDDAARSAASSGGMFNIIHPGSGLKIDVIVPSTELDQLQLGRAVRVPAFPGRLASFIAPEDVIVKKMEYYREGGSEKHLRDIAGILKITGERVDKAYVEQWVARLGLEEIWLEILRRLA